VKTLNQLEQEAKEARDCAIAVFDNDNLTSSQKVDNIILASVAMMTYQLALASQDQKEVDADGWIIWHGGLCCPVDPKTKVQVKFNTDPSGNSIGGIHSGIADNFAWGYFMNNAKIIAYRISKGE